MRLSSSFFYAKYGNIKFAYYAVRLIARDTPKKFAKINRVCYDIYINQKIDAVIKRKGNTMTNQNVYEVQYWGRNIEDDNKPFFVIRHSNGGYSEYLRLDPDSDFFSFLAYKTVNGLDIFDSALPADNHWQRVTRDVAKLFGNVCIPVIRDNHVTVEVATRYMDDYATQCAHAIIREFALKRRYADISEALLVKVYASYAAGIKGNGPRAHSHDIMDRVMNFARQLDGRQLFVGRDVFYRTSSNHEKFASFARGKIKKITETGVRLYRYSHTTIDDDGNTFVKYSENGAFVPFDRIIGNVVDTKLMDFWEYTKLTAKQYRDLSNIA